MIKRLLLLIASLLLTYQMWIAPSIIIGTILLILIVILFVALAMPVLGCIGMPLWTMPTIMVIGLEFCVILIKFNDFIMNSIK
jgi:hypothetical protein